MLQAIDADLDMNGQTFCEEVWLACHDDVEENVELARTIWEDNELQLNTEVAAKMLPYLDSTDKQLRRAAARSIGETISTYRAQFEDTLKTLQASYKERRNPAFPNATNMACLEGRSPRSLGVARRHCTGFQRDDIFLQG